MILVKKVFPVFALAACLFLAAFVSPFASSLPDGLEKVAADMGFKEKEASNTSVIAVAPDYAFPGVSDEKTSKSFSGVFGALAVLVVGAGVGYLMASRTCR